MKKIGLIGGMSWESSVVYYQIINESIREHLGGFHSARCIMESVDFAEIEQLQHQNDWSALDGIMVNAARNLENAGAELILLCTNTMHLCSAAIIDGISVPFIHIAQSTGMKIQSQGIRKVLLLGTKFTMEKPFFKNILKTDFELEVLVPNEKDRETVHDIIYKELVHGKLNISSKTTYQHIINKAISSGAQGVILGCTEIPLLINASDVGIPVFDTTRIHAEQAVEFALRLS
ncbi:aspartate/glutamate racemase family protein [Aggregatimonas sangjinii]|uniref:Aspartate/glutamate racemase family protein n=1 Tax=Aggregatimonas sangjinii TaxID=2583587 RepID=A0A5B7SQE6_9FLAO|nr:aspartate/glutamate racemase family protein [Aggregatimonas sangjinii]QCW99169.1 aspartate/glutamate racemase family protein [Aggregatimonas sangjinii]